MLQIRIGEDHLMPCLGQTVCPNSTYDLSQPILAGL